MSLGFPEMARFRIMRRLIVILGALSTVANGQDGPQTWFPLEIGTHWVYEHEMKSGDPNQPRVERWNTEETIVARKMIPEGELFLRELKEQGAASPQTNSKERAALVAHDRLPFLIRGKCVYVVGWDGQRLLPAVQEHLIEGNFSPDYCFPLKEATVEPGSKRDNTQLPLVYADAVHYRSARFGKGSIDIWFKKGIGVVAEHYVHDGSYNEYTKTLQLGPPAP